ncbi:EAL domain-containing response regulator [Litoribrevibacter albus]|uniref:Protein FimX n=1 Tax=Litoribrevibacter albus TaxID=1473156 RepID=A0AA37S9D2_9GAMM|nr:GGDEF domain-containing protein [Litoribrevibacter albus]GLQ30617.1 protein FimX [Litoribrevibacter albus]
MREIKFDQTIKLLLLDHSQNDAELMVSYLRNSGHATRAEYVDSLETFSELIKSGHWDLMIARYEAENLPYNEAIDEILKQDKDIPSVIVCDNFTPELVVETMINGASALAPRDDADHLLPVIKKELLSLAYRRELRSTYINLREAEKRCNLLLANSKDAIAYVHEGMHIYSNDAYMSLFGYDDPDELACIPIIDLVSSDNQDDFKQFLKDYRTDPSKKEFSCLVSRADDSDVKVIMEFTDATYDNEQCTQVIIRPDQDSEKLEAKLKEISSQDLLTGLFNRNHLLEQLETACSHAIQHNKPSSFMYIEIDDFTTANIGVSVSDLDIILTDIAQLVQTQLGEKGLCARVGDDDFGVLFPHSDIEGCKQLGEELRQLIEDHLSEVNSRTIQVTASLSLVPINETTTSANEILTRATDTVAKGRENSENKGNFVLLYVPEKPKLSGESAMAEELKQAIEDNRLKVLFQPIISLRGDSREIYEALIRMVDEDGKEIEPSDFLKAANLHGMSLAMDKWVIINSIKLLSAHLSKGHNTVLFINITAASLLEPTLPSWISKALRAARLPNDAIVFQIAEEDAITHLKQAKEFTQKLAELKCKASISHFGCATNPYNTLKHLVVEYIKIDGSYTSQIEKSDEGYDELTDMINAIQGQGKLSIVPMIESASTLAQLWQTGVNYIQGYFLQAPSNTMDYDFGGDI